MKKVRAALITVFAALLLVTALAGCGKEVINVTMRRDTFVLYDVCAVDASHVWAVGSRGKILFYDGKRWVPQDSGTRKALFGVSATDAERVWAVGGAGTVLYFDGRGWSKKEAPTRADLYDCAALETGKLWAVGKGVIVSHDDQAWDAWETGWTLGAVTASDDGHAWAAGDRGVLYFDGSWSEQFHSDVPLSGISAADATHVWAIGYSRRVTPLQVSTVFRFDGQWTQEMQFPDCQLRGVFALDPGNVWVAGIGANLHFDGSRWSRSNTTNYESYYAVSALGPDSAWIVGSELGGRLVAVPTVLTFDGKKWNRYNPPW